MSDIIRVLHIDDSLADRELVRDSLEKQEKGFKLIQASTQEEFEEYLNSVTFDIVLSDFNILGYEGLDIIEAVHKIYPNLPVIIVTGTGSEALAVESMKRGAADYIIKTLAHIQRLPYTIDAVLDKERLKAEYREAVNVLQESEEKYRSLVENADLGIAMISPEFKILSLSRQMKNWFPRAKDNGDHYCYKYFNAPPRSTTCEYCPVKKVFEDGRVHEAITDTPTPHGIRHYRIVASPVKSADGDVKSVIEAVEDYTNRTKAEAALKSSEKKFRSYVDNAPDGIFVVDENGNYIDVNKSASRITGYSREELLAMNILNLVPDKEHHRALEHFNELKDKGQSSGELLFRKKSGEIGYWIVDAVILDDGTYLGFVRDITEMHRLKALESRAERLELAGTIAGQVAHDLNNLLSPLLAYPEFIREELTESNNCHHYLNMIEESAQKIADINQDLLVMGRRGHYNAEVLNLNTVIHNVVMELQPFPKTIKCNIEYADDLMNILGGMAQLHRLISNMLHNAFDAMMGVGQLTIITENCYIDELKIDYGVVPRGEYVKLTISDTGCGIPDDVVQKIFDPFFSTKNADKKRGSGLGMSVVDAVIRDHRGYIDLTTRIGEGTTFYVYFPITRKDSEKTEITDIVGGDERILVVDDDDIQRDVSEQILRKFGYTVQSKQSGEKAVEFIKNNPQDLIVLDMVMPGGMDGTDTYREIKKIYPDQRAIILSGYSESTRVLIAQELGAGAFVQKPLTMSAFAEAVRVELDRP